MQGWGKRVGEGGGGVTIHSQFQTTLTKLKNDQATLASASPNAHRDKSPVQPSSQLVSVIINPPPTLTHLFEREREAKAHLHDALEEELRGGPGLVGEECRCHSGHHFQHSQQTDGDLKAGGADLHLPPLQHHVVRPQRHLLDLHRQRILVWWGVFFV